MAWSFFPACKVEDVPKGGKRRVVVEGYALCLVDWAGTLVAFADACPHEQVSLGEGGILDGGTLRCGAHHWVFELRTGHCRTDPQRPLRRFPVGRKDGVVYVGFWDGCGPEPGLG